MTMRRPSTPSSSPGCHRWTIRERLSPGWCLAGACRAGSRGDFRTLFPPLEQIFHARRRPVPHSGIGGLVASASQRVHVDLGQFVGRRLNDCHKLRRAVTSLAIGNVGKRQEAVTGGHGGDGHATEGCCDAHQKLRSHDTSRIAWAKLMARVGEEFPLECPWVWWRHPAQRRPPAGAGSLRTGGSQAEEGQDGFARVKSAPHTPRRAARASARLSRPWPADRLGQARADP
jgi:hypothetical protein